MEIELNARDRQGALVNLRRIRRAEVGSLHVLDRAIVAQGVGVVLHPDEVSAADSERNFDKLHRAGPKNAALLGAFVGHKLVANAEVYRLDLRSLRHAGMLTLGVHPRWQGRGIGRMLLGVALSWADGVGLERLELNVLADNHRAVKLYESMGFVLEGTRRGAFRFEDGRVVDDHMMARCRY